MAASGVALSEYRRFPVFLRLLALRIIAATKNAVHWSLAPRTAEIAVRIKRHHK
jgi:hypothetical protein